MDNELKEYLDNMETRLTGKIDNLDKKNDKAHKDILRYVEHIDSEMQEHRQNSEMHVKSAVGF